MPDPLPINPTRATAEEMKDDAFVMAGELRSLMGADPGPDQWRAAESLALGILSAVRKGRSAAILIHEARKAQAVRERAHDDAIVLQLERHGFAQDAAFLGAPRA